jgi:hypothetical protein
MAILFQSFAQMQGSKHFPMGFKENADFLSIGAID